MAKRIIDWQFSLHITLCILVMEGKKKEYHIYENVNYSRPHTNHNAMETFTFHHIEAYILYLKLRYSTLSEWGKKRAHFMLHQKIASAKMVNNNDNHLLLTMLFNAISFFHNHKNSTHTHTQLKLSVRLLLWLFYFCLWLFSCSNNKSQHFTPIQAPNQVRAVWSGSIASGYSKFVSFAIFTENAQLFPRWRSVSLELWISSISKALFRVDFEQSLKYLHILFKLSIWWPK